MSRAAAVLVVLLLTACGSAQVGGGQQECPDGAACTAPSVAPADQAVSLGRFDEPVGDGTTRLHTSIVDVVGNQVVIRVEYPDLCQRLLGAKVAETPQLVEVVAVGTARGDGPCPLRLASGLHTVTLDAPAGDRLVRVGG